MPNIFNKNHFQNKWQITHDLLTTSDFWQTNYFLPIFVIFCCHSIQCLLDFQYVSELPLKSKRTLKNPNISVAQNAVQWEKSDNLSPSIMQNCLDTLTLQIHYKDWLLSVQKPCWPTQLCCYFAENQQLRNRQHYTLWYWVVFSVFL